MNKKKEKEEAKKEQYKLMEQYQHQEWLKSQGSKDNSRERLSLSKSAKLPRSISPDSDQIELRKRYQEQQAIIKLEEKQKKEREQAEMKRLKKAEERQQGLLREAFEKQERFKNIKSRDNSKDR